MLLGEYGAAPLPAASRSHRSAWQRAGAVRGSVRRGGSGGCVLRGPGSAADRSGLGRVCRAGPLGPSRGAVRCGWDRSAVPALPLAVLPERMESSRGIRRLCLCYFCIALLRLWRRGCFFFFFSPFAILTIGSTPSSEKLTRIIYCWESCRNRWHFGHRGSGEAER